MEFDWYGGQTFASMDGEFHHGDGDGFLRKYNRDGVLQWTRMIGTRESDDLHAMQIVGEEIYLTGATRGSMDGSLNRGWTDGYLAKMTTDGLLQGVLQFGTEQIDYPRDVLFHNGKLIVGGMTEGSLVGPSSGGVDLFIAEFDPVVLDGLTVANDQWILY